jgi:hypothetical protein
MSARHEDTSTVWNDHAFGGHIRRQTLRFGRLELRRLRDGRVLVRPVHPRWLHFAGGLLAGLGIAGLAWLLRAGGLP